MYSSGARSTMIRLERMVGSGSVTVADPSPANTTVRAGWICCALGLLSAWFFPPATLFFLAAFVLSLVAMSTRQLRQGAILLVTSSLGAVGCLLVFSVLVAGAASGLIDDFRHKVAVLTARQNTVLAQPKPTGRVVLTPTQTNYAVKAAPPAQPYYPPASPPVAVVSVRDPLPVMEGVPNSPVNYQEKDRRIKELKDQGDALDEDVRRIRNNPRSYPSWYSYYSGNGYNGIDQQRLASYLKILDERRNDLRRKKWRLEGR